VSSGTGDPDGGGGGAGGGAGGGGGSVANDFVPSAQFTTELYKAICAHEASCGTAKSFDSCFQYSQSALVASAGTTTLNNFRDQHLAEQKISYDGAAAARCLRGYANAGCSLPLTPVDDCASVYVGRVPVGSPCRLLQCVPGAFCTSEVDLKCPGTCKARLPAGAAATSITECEVGLVVVSGKCAPPRKEGEACATHGPVGDCATGLTCAFGSKTCVKRRVGGDACSDASECATYTRCLNGKCAAFPDVGEPCDLARCKLGLMCGAGGTCVQPGGAGAVCTSTGCLFDLRCGKATPSATEKTCQKPTPLDGACAPATPSTCGAGLYCSSGSMTCVPRLEAGAACTAVDGCKAGPCTAGKCPSTVSSLCL
jgi:hypothetical protein